MIIHGTAVPVYQSIHLDNHAHISYNTNSLLHCDYQLVDIDAIFSY